METHLNLPEGLAVFQVDLEKPYRVIVSKMGYYPVYFDLLASKGQVFSDLEKTVLLKPMRQKAVEDLNKGN